MADKESGNDIFRIIAFGILGAALVIIGFVARGMVDESNVTDAPTHWLGPTFTGTVIAYEEGKSITIKGEEEGEWTCAIDGNTKLTTASGDALTTGSLVQVKFRGGEKNPTAKNIRVIENKGAEPSSSATPSGTPAADATPSGTPTPVATP